MSACHPHTSGDSEFGLSGCMRSRWAQTGGCTSTMCMRGGGRGGGGCISAGTIWCGGETALRTCKRQRQRHIFPLPTTFLNSTDMIHQTGCTVKMRHMLSCFPFLDRTDVLWKCCSQTGEGKNAVPFIASGGRVYTLFIYRCGIPTIVFRYFARCCGVCLQ